MSEFSTENLNVGDKVKIVGYNGFSAINTYEGEVIKKTMGGKIDVKYNIEITCRFDPNGQEYARNYRNKKYLTVETL